MHPFRQGALGILPPSALQSNWRHFTESLFGRLEGRAKCNFDCPHLAQRPKHFTKPLTNWILHGRNTHRWIGMDCFRENWRRPIGCLSFKYKRRVPLKRLEVSLVICQLGVWQGTENDNQERF